ncbi:MAG: hypothetical protein QM756_09465 [Polyangiaceae bacterium]
MSVSARTAEHAPRSMLDAPPPARRSPWLAMLATTALHGALVGMALLLGLQGAKQLGVIAPVTEMVEVELPKAPEPEPEPPAETPPEPPTKLVRAQATPQPPAATPPAAAVAGQVLAAADEVADFGDTFVVGKGSSYAGGTTDANGTSKRAVRDSGAQGSGAVAPVAAAAPDLSREPSLAGGSRWDCPFPEEADADDIDHAVVVLQIEVSADGRAVNAKSTSDPGHGFAREARRCALRKTFSPGLDRAGKPIVAFKVVKIHFDR